ncbi:GtrA family protein [Aquisalibacillus elongatus]|uniref:Putative flippase GtrA n=1 Tax=Aquisalibacillus elongatus TaxID=485577 RepID=A0A3N5BD87_9BACI|nr:GtrA family protein [Aquisalibacillus elongatus]RPF53300.1 putative flippase GtrA [Aquisalibacillus elongatus]
MGQKKKGPLQFLQFSAIGAANAGIDIGTLNLLLILFPTDEKWLLVLFNTIAYSLAIINSYFWNARFTFQRSAEGSKKQRSLFIVQGIISLGVSNVVFIASHSLISFTEIPNWLRYNISKGLAMFLSFLSSFFMIKYIVFKDFESNR